MNKFRIKDLAIINPRLNRERHKADTVVSFVPMAAVSDKSYQIEKEETGILSQYAKGYTYFEKGDLLLAKITPCFENGKLTIAHISHEIGFGSTEFYVLRANPKMILAKFLFYILRSSKFKSLGKRNMTGSAGQKRLRKDFLENYQIVLPSLDEQLNIINILDQTEFLRNKRNDVINLLDSYIDSVFLDIFGDPGKNINKYKEVLLKEVSVKITDGEHITPKRTSFGIKLLSARNVKNGYIDFDAGVDYISTEEYQRIIRRCNPEFGDLLISCSGTIGRVTTIDINEPFTLVRSAALVKPDKEKINVKYLEYYLRSSYLQNLMIKSVNQSSQANLFLGQINKLPILVPPLDKQNLFVDIVQKKDLTKAIILKQLDQFDYLFQSLTQKSFSAN